MNAAGLKEVMYEGINAGEKDYTALVTKLKDLKAEVVYFGGYHPEAGLILRQAAEQNLQVPADHARHDRFARVLAGRRPGRRRHAVRLPGRPAGRSRKPRKRSRRSRPAASCRKASRCSPMPPIQAFAQGIERAGSGRSVTVAAALKNGAADRHRGRPDHLRREGRHQGRHLRHQRVA